MKKVVALAIVFICSLSYIGYAIAAVPDIQETLPTPLIKGAHRGASVEFIENTLPALQEAAQNPEYKFIEIDIQYTKDKQIILFHDNSLQRLQGLEYNVEDLTYENLTHISAFHIPTYQEAMGVIGNSKPLNVEIKSQGNLRDDQALVDFVVADFNKRGLLDQLLLSSISADVISYISQEYPSLKTGKIYWTHTTTFFPIEFVIGDLYLEMQEIGADYVMLHGMNIKNFDVLEEYKPQNTSLVFWYFSDEMYIVADEQFQFW